MHRFKIVGTSPFLVLVQRFCSVCHTPSMIMEITRVPTAIPGNTKANRRSKRKNKRHLFLPTLICAQGAGR
jgi:hypothetical protein